MTNYIKGKELISQAEDILSSPNYRSDEIEDTCRALLAEVKRSSSSNQYLQGEVNRLNNVIAERDCRIDRIRKQTERLWNQILHLCELTKTEPPMEFLK